VMGVEAGSASVKRPSQRRAAVATWAAHDFTGLVQRADSSEPGCSTGLQRAVDTVERIVKTNINRDFQPRGRNTNSAASRALGSTSARFHDASTRHVDADIRMTRSASTQMRWARIAFYGG